MPVGVVKTPKDEKNWEKAKAAAAKEGQAKHWPLIMHIFEGMHKDEDRNIKIQAALASQGKKTALPPEIHEHLHSWWQQNKAKALNPEQHQRLKDVQSVKQKRASFKVAKNISDYEDLLKSIKAELDKIQKSEKPAPKPKKAPMKEWEPRAYKPHEATAIQGFVDQGYHPREAAHLADVETARPGQSFKATPLSPAMLEQLKPIAKDMVKQFRDERNTKAQPHVNPDIAVAHQTKQIFGKLNDNMDDALKAFKESGELQKLPPHERLKALNNFKADWHAKNLEAKTKNMSDVAQEHKEANEQAQQAHGKHVLESMRSIAQGGSGGIITPDMQASYQPETDYDTASDVGNYDEGDDGQE